MEEISSIPDQTLSKQSEPTRSIAKLRLLKIQEKVLNNVIAKTIQNLCKASSNDSLETVHVSRPSSGSIKIVKSLEELQTLFEDIKEMTSQQEKIDDCDINLIKKNVLTVENNIDALKSCLQTEMSLLKHAEQDLTNQIDNSFISTEQSGFNKTVYVTKVRLQQFNSVVPSPVKALINIPPKCKEVQDFQQYVFEHSRHGKWNQYNHNIFVQSWNKYFRSSLNENFNIISASDNFSLFVQELSLKIPGVTLNEINGHSKWYLEYLHLEDLQKQAIYQWREKRSIVKKSQHTGFNFLESELKFSVKSKNNCPKYSSDSNGSLKRIGHDFFYNQLSQKNESCSKKKNYNKADYLTRITRPTDQWNNRCFGAIDVTYELGKINSVESIQKLCVPQWRASL